MLRLGLYRGVNQLPHNNTSNVRRQSPSLPERVEHLPPAVTGFASTSTKPSRTGLASVDPAVHGAALHEDVARLEVHLGAFSSSMSISPEITTA